MFIKGIKSSTCNRCGLEVNHREDSCHHCSGLTDGQARKLRSEYRKNIHTLNSDIRSLFVKLAIVSALILILLSVI